MNDESDGLIENATIKWNGETRGEPGEEPIELYAVETSGGTFWFEAYYVFADNTVDFRVTVRNFGLPNKLAGGSTAPWRRRRFSSEEAQAAQSRLNALFLGPHNNPNLPYVPFRWGKSKCQGVDFPEGWITIE
jgi:hypothetical protein